MYLSLRENSRKSSSSYYRTLIWLICSIWDNEESIFNVKYDISHSPKCLPLIDYFSTSVNLINFK